MRFQPTAISGAFVVELEPREDHRGSFSRIYCQRELADQGLEFVIAQCNLASTRHAGTVRGLHFQDPPALEQKLVRCVAGGVYDVIVDMREESPTYRRKVELRLDAANRLALFIPARVAHGYQALSANTDFLYLTDEFYAPGVERGVRFDDPALAIQWPLEPVMVTDRDRSWPLLAP